MLEAARIEQPLESFQPYFPQKGGEEILSNTTNQKTITQGSQFSKQKSAAMFYIPYQRKRRNR